MTVILILCYHIINKMYDYKSEIMITFVILISLVILVVMVSNCEQYDNTSLFIDYPMYCDRCEDKNDYDCSNCVNCGICSNKLQSKCTEGNKKGSYFMNCDKWHYGQVKPDYKFINNYPYDYYYPQLYEDHYTYYGDKINSPNDAYIGNKSHNSIYDKKARHHRHTDLA